MNRSELLYVMSLGRGNVPHKGPLDNRWYVHHGWSDAARAAALAVRRAKAAARAGDADDGGMPVSGETSTGSSPSSSGGADDNGIGLKDLVRVSGLTVGSNGRVSVGFTDYSVDPPVNRLLREDREDGGWTVKDADYDAGTVTLAKDGKEETFRLGTGPSVDGHRETETGQAGGASLTADAAPAGVPVSLNDAWDDYEESGIWEMAEAGREAIYDELRDRVGTTAEDEFSEQEKGFLSQYERLMEARERAADFEAARGEALGNRACRLANRVSREACGRLANVGWTDRAREISLAVRRGMAEAREVGEGIAEGVPFRASGGTWIKENGEVRCLRIDGVYAAPTDGRYITELAKGEWGTFRDPYALGTLNAMERYGYITPERAAAARVQYGYVQANRGSGLRGRALANVGWTDEARAAALAARRAKAAGAVTDSPGRSPAVTPPQEGTIVIAGGGVSIMQNGKLVRIGSTKVLCVLPDGQLGVKRGDKAYPIGKPSDWRTGMARVRIVKGWDGKFYLDCGKGLLSLEDGKVRLNPNQPRPNSRGMIVIQRGYDPFSQGGVPIPPDPPDISQRRDIQY